MDLKKKLKLYGVLPVCHHYPPIFQARIWKSPSTSSILPPASQQLPSASLCALISFYLRTFFSPLSPPWLCSLPSISTDHGDLTSGPHHLVPTFPLVLSFTNFLCFASAGGMFVEYKFYSDHSTPPPAQVAYKTQLDPQIFAQFTPTFYAAPTLTSIKCCLEQGHLSMP